jgi:hypothetical protein
MLDKKEAILLKAETFARRVRGKALSCKQADNQAWYINAKKMSDGVCLGRQGQGYPGQGAEQILGQGSRENGRMFISRPSAKQLLRAPSPAFSWISPDIGSEDIGRLVIAHRFHGLLPLWQKRARHMMICSHVICARAWCAFAFPSHVMTRL